MIKFIGLVAIIIIFNFLENFPRIKQCKNYISMLEKVDEKNEAQLDDLNSHKSEILVLLIGANASDESIIRYMDTDGMASIAKKTSLFDSFPYESTVRSIEIKLKQSLGFYELMYKRMLNPLYWVRYFMNLPAHIAVSLGIKNDNVQKILNVVWRIALIVWWLFTPVIEELRQKILDLMIGKP